MLPSVYIFTSKAPSGPVPVYPRNPSAQSFCSHKRARHSGLPAFACGVPCPWSAFLPPSPHILQVLVMVTCSGKSSCSFSGLSHCLCPAFTLCCADTSVLALMGPCHHYPLFVCLSCRPVSSWGQLVLSHLCLPITSPIPGL